jgi:hemoglobin-like flavoprotein
MDQAQTLTGEEIELVRGSFDRIWGIAGRTADIFYDRLFTIAPHVRPLFCGDPSEQKRKFMSTLAIIVSCLDDSARLVPLTGDLGRQHLDYGIVQSHYSVVGEALLWSLEQGLGPHWTPGVAASWTKAYSIVSGHMIERAYS